MVFEQRIWIGGVYKSGGRKTNHEITVVDNREHEFIKMDLFKNYWENRTEWAYLLSKIRAWS